jgi:hypothetical protein
MTRVLHRHRTDEALIPCATAQRRPEPPARPRPGISGEVLSELRADSSLAIAATLAEAEHVRASRDAACRLLFDEDRKRREDIDGQTWVDDALGRYMAEETAAILATVTARPELLHNTALLMALAPIVAQLKGVDVPEATDAERWATQHRMNDAVDVLGVGDVVITYDPEHPYLGVQGTVTAVDSTGVTVQFADHDIRTLPASELVLSVRVAAQLKGSVA